MALVSAMEVPPELLRLFNELLRVNDARRYGSVAKRGHLLSKAQSRAVSTRSLLPEISALWAGLSSGEKLAWKTAGEQSSYNPWNLFVQDTAYRLKYGIPGIATPSNYHQYKVGRLEINSPAAGARLAQYHPIVYWKLQKVRGSKALYIDQKITEKFALPLEIGISYRSDLTLTSGEATAEFYAEVTSSYQGRDIITKVGFDLALQTGWTRQTALCTEVLGAARSYNLFINFGNVRGYFEWDNLESNHTGTNYARDFRCSDVNNTLTRSNYQIEKSWEEEFLPTGSAFDSVYPTD